MMEFEINMSEMPLGKLSKSNIQKGMLHITFYELGISLFPLFDCIKQSRSLSK